MAVAPDDLTDESDVGVDAAGAPVAAARAPSEGWWVVLRRVSGLVLAVAVPVHLALTRVLADPADASVPVVRDRWSQPGWRVLECLLLAAVAVHVVAAVQVSLSRSRWSVTARTAVLTLVAAIATASVLFTSAVVVTAPW